MIQILQSASFSKWLSGLRDRQARTRINDRLLRMQGGNIGDVKTVAKGFLKREFTAVPGIVSILFSEAEHC